MEVTTRVYPPMTDGEPLDWSMHAPGVYVSSMDSNVSYRVAPACLMWERVRQWGTDKPCVVYELSYRFGLEGRWWQTDTRGTVSWCMRVAEIKRIGWKR